MSKEKSGGPTPEQIAGREERLREVEAARNSPIFGPYFRLAEANVLANSTHVEPADIRSRNKPRSSSKPHPK